MSMFRRTHKHLSAHTYTPKRGYSAATSGLEVAEIPAPDRVPVADGDRVRVFRTEMFDGTLVPNEDYPGGWALQCDDGSWLRIHDTDQIRRAPFNPAHLPIKQITDEQIAVWKADPEGLKRARAHDRSPGRWCAACNQRGSHHTDRHGHFADAKASP